jgi:hypothetical protein
MNLAGMLTGRPKNQYTTPFHPNHTVNHLIPHVQPPPPEGQALEEDHPSFQLPNSTISYRQLKKIPNLLKPGVRNNKKRSRGGMKRIKRGEMK